MIFLLIAVTGMSQFYLNVSGTITNLSNGQPIPNQQVVIDNDSNAGTGYFYQVTYTDNFGHYNDTIPISGTTQGNVYVSTVDCQNLLHVQNFVYSPAQYFFTADFSICYNNNPCQPYFTFQQNQPLVVEFFDASIGGGTARNWDFGDGTTSSLFTPVHTYALPGIYYVTLTIGAQGTTCYQSMTMAISVWGNTSGCQSAFTYYPDSSSLNNIQFINQSTGNIFSYLWDFGDGATSTEENPAHTYAAAGTYNVCLTVQGDSNCFDTECQSVSIQPGGDCQAMFHIYPDSNALYSYYFDNQSIGNITTWEWNFNDGTPPLTVTFPNNPSVHHAFPGPGYYVVCLTVHNNNNTCFDVMCDTLIIDTPPPCLAFFDYFPDSVNLTHYYFNDLSTGNINSWSWNFGDPASGANNTSTLQNPSHNFSGAGTYTVTLTVSGADSNCFAGYYTTIVIEGAPGCQANFDFNNTIPPGNTISFIDLSTGSPTSWTWSFGDGTTSSVQNPTHTYAVAGVYDVTLTIFGNNCQSSVVKPVTVGDSTNYQHIYGQVFAGNFPVTTGMAMIFTANAYSPVTGYFAAAPLDSNGVYYFTLVPEGNYFVIAIPLEASGYVPTYYGNTINWELATILNLGTANNPYNINLVATDQLTGGPGSVSGLIGSGDYPLSMLDKIQMILKNESGQPIGFTQVSSDGTFGFPSLTYGTYYLIPELPGVNSQQVMVTLTESKPHAEVVMTYNGNSILGIGNRNDRNALVQLFPNPVQTTAWFDISAPGVPEVTVEILDMTGRRVLSQFVRLTGESTRAAIHVQSLKPGVYVYRINSGTVMLTTGRMIRID